MYIFIKKKYHKPSIYIAYKLKKPVLDGLFKIFIQKKSLNYRNALITTPWGKSRTPL